jgi:hypothetical protein
MIEEAVKDQGSGETDDIRADLCLNCGQVCLSQGEVELGAKQVDGPILEGMRQDITSVVGSRHGTEVSVTEPRSEAIGLVVAICHVKRALQQFDVKLDSQDGESLDARRD